MHPSAKKAIAMEKLDRITILAMVVSDMGSPEFGQKRPWGGD